MAATETSVRIPVVGVVLDADVVVPPNPRGVVLFAHGSGSGRHSPRNRYVAGELQKAGLATVLAALVAAAARPSTVAAVVSRGGRPDLAGEFLRLVRQPTLLIVGGRDPAVLE